MVGEPLGDRRRIITGADILGRLLRGIAKGILFAQTSPEAAVRVYYQANPTKKPVGEAATATFAKDVELLKRALKLYSIEGRQIEQWGASYKPGWEAVRDFYIAQGTLQEKRDVEEYYISPGVTEQINRFDADAVIKAAESYE